MTTYSDGDRHRPRYHFLPPANWMNDPNGLIHYKGNYHLFYQYNPNGAFWGTMHWGHAISKDLVTWRHMPIALTPLVLSISTLPRRNHRSESVNASASRCNGPDRDGCYSGAAVVHDGGPTLVYTGVREPDELPCLAMSEDDDLTSRTKHAGNPVLTITSPDVHTTIFRDHTFWREDGVWMMGVGSGIKGQSGAVLLFQSSDLMRWEYLHPLVVEDPELNPSRVLMSTGWECPDFFFPGEQPALIACDWDGDPLSVSYWTGDYSGQKFIPRLKGVVDPGSSFYAPQSFVDTTGRRVMFGWLREACSDAAQRVAGWSRVMSLPRVVSMQDDGTFAFAVAPEVNALRGRSLHIQPEGRRIDLNRIPGDALELCASFASNGNGSVGMEVRCADDLSERTTIIWDSAAWSLSLDTRRSSLDPLVDGERISTSIDLAADEPVRLRVFVDRSVIEVYANRMSTSRCRDGCIQSGKTAWGCG